MDKDFDSFKKIGEEDHNPDLSPQQGDDPLDTGDIDNSQGAGGTPDNLWIGNKTKVTTGYGIGKCSHSSTSGLHSMKKTGKLKVVAASIGEGDDVGTEEEPMPALKPPVDVYKAPTGTDEENMGGVVEIRKIATESDTTSPMEVREQGENVVIIGGGLDDTITVRTTEKGGTAADKAWRMTFLDGILTELDDYVDYGDGKSVISEYISGGHKIAKHSDGAAAPTIVEIHETITGLGYSGSNLLYVKEDGTTDTVPTPIPAGYESYEVSICISGTPTPVHILALTEDLP